MTNKKRSFMKAILTGNALALLLVLILFNPIPSNADQGTGTIVLSVKYRGGDLADTSDLTMKIYQDNGNVPYIDTTRVPSLPYDISSLPLNHQYKIEVYEGSMHSGYGIVDLTDKQQNLDLVIPQNMGMRFSVYYDDGKTPISGARVGIKSNDGIEWNYGVTDPNGQTKTFYQPTSTNSTDYYYAEVSLGRHLLYTFSPILPSAGSGKRDFDIVTKWPVVANPITIQVYKTPDTMVGQSDGNLGIELRDLNNNKIVNAPVSQRGDVYLSNLKVGNYLLFVVQNPNSQTGQYKELISAKITIGGSENIQKIFINNPELNGDLNCKCVAFRLDDVQDNFLNSVQMDIIKEFQDKDASLTLGIIGQYFGKDPKLVNYIKSLVDKPDPILEPAIHTWTHPDMITLSRTEQFKQINLTSARIHDILGITPETYIPPYNHFNDDTLSVLQELGIAHISYHTHTAQPPPFVKSTLYHFPATTATASIELSGVPPWKTVVADSLFRDINNEVPYYGFGVVNMHPYEFSNYVDGKYTNSINQTQLDQLGLAIDKIKAAGYKLVPIENIDSVALPQPSASPQPPVIQSPAKPNCNCVAFRLDVVQDYSISNVELAIIKSFQQKNTALTVGVIGKEIGSNPKVVGQLKGWARNNSPPLEFANRGWDNLDHTQYTKDIQSASIKKTSDKISSMFGSTASIFIPPFNKFNNDTLSALRENGIEYISSTAALDPGPYNLHNDLPFHIPQTALLSDLLSDDPFYPGEINDKALAKIKINLNTNGFSVATIRAQDIAVKNGDIYNNQVDVQKLQSLESLIDFLKSNGIKIVTIDQIPQEATTKKSPSWASKYHDWYQQGQISAEEVLNAKDYLIQNGIVKFNN